MTVWVDDVPCVAVVGPRGLEIRGSYREGHVNSSEGIAGHPFAFTGQRPEWEQESPKPPPPPPPRSNSPLRFSPKTPNGTRVPKGAPPADSMEWPDWTRPVDEVHVGCSIPPPPIPNELRGIERT